MKMIIDHVYYRAYETTNHPIRPLVRKARRRLVHLRADRRELDRSRSSVGPERTSVGRQEQVYLPTDLR